jgi:hypothetical protein
MLKQQRNKGDAAAVRVHAKNNKKKKVDPRVARRGSARHRKIGRERGKPDADGEARSAWVLAGSWSWGDSGTQYNIEYPIALPYIYTYIYIYIYIYIFVYIYICIKYIY